MNKISSTIVGAAREYYVLSQLLRRGWIATLAPDGAPNMDILVTDENSDKLCAIQVKTRRDWIATLAPDGAPNMDILVTDENSDKLCAIQVKTRRDIGRDKGGT